MKKAIAMMLVLMMALSMVASAERLTPSKGFKLPAVKHRPTATPVVEETGVPTEAPETTAPAETGAPEETEAPVETEAPAQTGQPETDTAIGKACVNLANADSTLNVRAAAAGDAEVIGYLSNGVEVDVLGTEGDWTKVRTADGAVGYVKSSYLAASVEEPEMPTVSDAPIETEEPEVTDEPIVEETELPVVTDEPIVEETEQPVVTDEPIVEETEQPVVTDEPVVEETEAPAETTEEPVVETTEEPAVTEEPTVEPTEEPTAEPEYLTDAEGNVIVDGNGNPVVVGDYLFDENGNVMFDLNGNVIPFGNYQVDENGALIFDENGMPIPVVEEEAVPEVDPLEGLRQIIVVLHEGEMFLPLHAEPNAESSIVANIPAGEILYVKDIEAEWSYAVYGELEGYVLTSKIALYNEETTPEEEEIVRTIKMTSNVEGASVVYEGDEIVLTAVLTGFEDDNYSVQWQYTPDGGATVHDVEGANELSYSFIIDRSNAEYLWRIRVTILAPEVEETPAATE